ncbi:hypothetical protein OOZ15_18360 [Galbibacter sp. EGI 63066]|uniref:hypothetical protein n=1 Tax=Galbibacter sp. EGI 63066 TaxID=2993559 RepID=UPI002249821D|nr:hypothetical protein [Galbibacter sp. EGI 63066]MCX2681921.1 hypothetical protein [Galbibacter sp. EGI 63066]
MVEAETSAAANVAALTLIKTAENRVHMGMKNLNAQIRKELPYYGFTSIFSPIFRIDNAIVRVRQKLSEAIRNNNSIPLLFKRKKNKRQDKLLIYTAYLNSIESDIGVDFSNHGNLIKTCMEIVSELEKVEEDLDNILEDLTVAERFFLVFQSR